MTEVSRISDAELNNIEREIADLYLEEVIINGIQLKAIVQRLRAAERAVDIATPYMTRAADRQKVQELNSKWGMARFGSLMAGLVAGIVGVGATFYVIQPVDTWMADNQVWVFLATVTLSFMLPLCMISLPLLKKIDKVVMRELEKARG